MAELTVAAGVVRGLIAFAGQLGVSPQVLAESADIDVAALGDGDGRIPMLNYVALMRSAKALSGDTAFALRFGSAVDLSEVSLVGLIGLASETMLDALVQLNRYGQLVVEVELDGPDRFVHHRRPDGLWLVDHRKYPNSFPELTELTFARIVSGTRSFGETPFVRAVHVTHSDPGTASEYRSILGAPVTFNSHWNALQVDEAWTSYPIAKQPRYVFGIVSARADTLLSELKKSKSLAGRIEARLMPILHTGEASIERIARDMGLSRQTLYRRLKAEGISFAKLLDTLRHRLALDYLAGQKVSVNETAYLVGFSDPAAFSRAYKRWTGQSPGAVKRSGKQQGVQ